MLIEHLILLLIWTVYYALHSLFASTYMKNKLGLKQQHYRLLYGLFSTLLFGCVLIYNATIYSALIYPPNNLSIYLGLMIAATGFFIVKRSFRQYSFREFMGLKAEKDQQLQTKGIQSKVRHPLYTGTILIFLGYFIFNPQFSNLIMLMTMLIYLPIGIYLEERKLLKEFGEEYLQYKHSTPALFPNFFKKQK